MAALAVVQNDSGMKHDMAMAMSPEVSFPYGFPAAGHYRLFVQVKRGERVETGSIRYASAVAAYLRR